VKGSTTIVISGENAAPFTPMDLAARNSLDLE